MDERRALAWLGRKVAWGFTPGQLDDWVALGPSAVIDRLVDPDAHGVAERPDAFAGVEVDPDSPGRGIRRAVNQWIENAVTSPRPLETFMEFFWSDYFAVSTRVLRPREMMFDHMRLLRRHALGNFRQMLLEVTVDPAMLDFLDGGRNLKDRPNENYARELLELYSVGVGEFTEDDVQAASKALTGYRLRGRSGDVRYRRRQHDDTPQVLLGIRGVNDVETTIEAVLAHPSTAANVVDKLATAILGLGFDPGPVTSLGKEFAQDWELRPIVRTLLELGVDGNVVPTIVEPLAWYVAARRVPTVRPEFRDLREFFRQSGQVPMFPPNVGGFPGADAYLSTSATLARINMASDLAQRSGDLDLVALTEDPAELAQHLGLVDGFEATSAEALRTLEPGVDRFAAALASPELVVA